MTAITGAKRATHVAIVMLALFGFAI